MQVASTLWPDIKSQKISERRFRLIWIKCSPRTIPKSVKTRQAPAFRQVEAQDSPLEEDGADGGSGRSTDLPGRPNWPVGPTASTLPRVTSSLVAQVGSASSHPWLLAINTRGGVGIMTHTPHFLLSCTSCIVFRLSGV